MGPIHQVYISLIASLVIGLGLFTYRYLFPKRSISPLILVFALSLLPLISIFRPGTYESGDLSLHATRAISFYNVLSTEYTIPKWSPELNIGYGDAYFEFIYVLPYLVISLFHTLGLGFLWSVKLLLICSYIGSGIVFYLFANREFSNKWAAFVGSIFYLYAPYHLVDMHFRVSIAECLAFFFVPLVFYLTRNLISTPRIHSVLYLAFALCGLLLSHQVIFISAFPFLIGYYLLAWNFTTRNKTAHAYFILSILISLLLSAFHWLPIILESQYIYQVFWKGIINYTPLQMLLYSPWRYGLLFQGHHGELSFIIGYTQLIIFFLSLLLLLRHKIKGYEKIRLFFFFLSFIVLFIMMLSISQPLWEIVPLIDNFQFTYRLLLMETFVISILATIVISSYKNNRLLSILVIVTIFYTILNWGNRGNIPDIGDTYLRNNLVNGLTVTGTVEPTAPRWVDPNHVSFSKRPLAHLEVLSGGAIIKEIKRSSYIHEYQITATTSSLLKENTFYFPGWNLTINKKAAPITYLYPKFPGVIIFRIPQGKSQITLSFSDTPIRSVAKTITLLTLLLTGIMYLKTPKGQDS